VYVTKVVLILQIFPARMSMLEISPSDDIDFDVKKADRTLD
jgi:hypothetical protein